MEAGRRKGGGGGGGGELVMLRERMARGKLLW